MRSPFALGQYGIVMDAGSSHTTVYVYRWPADKQNGTGVVSQHSECKVKGQSMHHNIIERILIRNKTLAGHVVYRKVISNGLV